jgi:hypothetical protein
MDPKLMIGITYFRELINALICIARLISPGVGEPSIYPINAIQRIFSAMKALLR